MQATTPAWLLAVVPLITAAGVIAAQLVAARTARTRQERELRQERFLHTLEDRRKVLDDAAELALRYRERLAAALRQIEGSSSELTWAEPDPELAPLVAASRADRFEFRRLEAQLIIRFGQEDEVTVAFSAVTTAFLGALDFLRRNGDLPSVPDLVDEARRTRRSLKPVVEQYLVAAAETVGGSAAAADDAAPATG
jgi:hypothetical protein